MREPKEVSLEAQMLFVDIKECDGMEVHKDDWHLLDELKEAGYRFQTTGRRGPGREWIRAYLPGGCP